MDMNALICNKCFAPTYRAKLPYHITQCGHIFCQGCVQQAEKQCPQCQRIGCISLPLEEPLPQKLIPYFQPIGETLETLMKMESFRSNELKILLQRFNELDKKYELLKTYYWQQRRVYKELMEKNMILKEKIKDYEKLLLSEKQRKTPRPMFQIMQETPSDSGVSMNPSNISGYSMDSSMEIFKTPNITPMSFDLRKQYRNADGFRIPGRRPPKTRFPDQS
ncbi:chromosome stability protein 9 isoform X1 [Solenopsis invicta]|uniref:chromosome stability protein 9 isoform X1 n=1 Tax=Solenopsis invicta TaxID=13686 RepID=UPI0001FEBFC6|nr:chromosome stability protein 9 isoform X1 [Solenopsis invicta]XP_011157089.1 chromosome stability protein 9 isoform X1 [Solenopsis invicta]XP_011157090.1 chromosome stability protein 9 isoform X1 [Solenopsis invicta]XP_011157091.1 chromosome stability protein 9 isoform X1 [Solenopsis invicta]XP_011157093.1 chromosome stability protein 9 isoform X1 [Solenopsis invicta]